MSGPLVHIHDIRETLLTGYGWEGKNLIRVYQEAFTFGNSDESLWLSSICEHLQSCRERNSADVVILMPNRVTLFKIVKIPMVRSSAGVIRHEVMRGFPHAEEELVWNAVPLVSDAIEQWFLIAAVRRQVCEALSKAVLPSKALLVPRFSLEVAAESKHFLEISVGTTRHLLNLDLDMGVHLAISKEHAVVRTLRWSHPLSEDGSPESAEHDALISEVRRSRSFMSRQFAGSKTQDFCFCGSLSARSGSCQEIAEILGLNGSLGLKTLSRDTAVQECISQGFRKQNLDAVRLSPWVVREWTHLGEKPGAARARGLLYAVCMLALMPFPWVISHHLAMGDLKESLHSYQEQYRVASAGNDHWIEQTKLLESMGLELDRFRWMEQTHPAWLDLLAHLQTSLIEVGDLWIDELDVSLATALQPKVSMTFSGRFLVRQRNLEQRVRPQVIQDTEHRLKLLQSKLLASPLIGETVDFKVNYEGIETGINVVMFSMKLRLTEPFSVKEEGGSDG
jgi:hypothetical protein